MRSAQTYPSKRSVKQVRGVTTSASARVQEYVSMSARVYVHVSVSVYVFECVYVCMHVCMFVLYMFSHTKSAPVPDGQKLLHDILEITPPIRKEFLMPK